MTYFERLVEAGIRPDCAMETCHWFQTQGDEPGLKRYVDEVEERVNSDYCKVAKKLGVNTVDFYACMAEAFLKDKDAVGGGGAEKLAAYYNNIVKH